MSQQYVVLYTHLPLSTPLRIILPPYIRL